MIQDIEPRIFNNRFENKAAKPQEAFRTGAVK